MSRRKQQRYKAKKRKQTHIALTKQIRSESMQCSWQEKTAMEATTKKLISQFGFTADPTLSTRHNASITLATTPTWYYFSRPTNLAFHNFTKRHKPKKTTITIGIGTKIHPNPRLNKLMESAPKIILRSTVPLRTPTIPLRWQTTKRRDHLL